VRGEAGASDHAPAWVELKEASGGRSFPSRTKERSKARPERRPLLVIDGDSFAHRSYHALPKTIRRDGGRPAGAILGFANRLLQLYRTERPRAVLVGWIRSKRRPTGTRLFPHIRVAATSMTSSSSSLALIGPKEVHERHGVAPKQVPDFIALRGDPSDRLPGAPGVGAQGAAALIR